MAFTDSAGLLRRIGKVDLAKLVVSDGSLVDTPADADIVLGLAEPLAKLNQAIDDGAAEISGYVLGHLDITDSANIAALERLNAILAFYNLYALPQNSSSENPYADYRQQALDYLTNIAKGRFHTGIEPQTPAAAVGITPSTRAKVFTADATENF